MPDAALVRDLLDRARREDPSAGGNRGAGEAAHIGERLDRLRDDDDASASLVKRRQQTQRRRQL
jgi:hypothetical protein